MSPRRKCIRFHIGFRRIRKWERIVILSEQSETKNLPIDRLHSSKSVRRSFGALSLAQDDKGLHCAFPGGDPSLRDGL